MSDAAQLVGALIRFSTMEVTLPLLSIKNFASRNRAEEFIPQI
jgi:hypothetical protein